MKIKVSEATNLQLEWMVCAAEKLDAYIPAYAETPWVAVRSSTGVYRSAFTTDWALAGPIIEREFVDVCVSCTGINQTGQDTDTWHAYIDVPGEDCLKVYGPTPLVAAMRCFVASKLGDEVEVPGEL